MADIASLAGVSVSTVSRALAGHLRVKQQTRERIAELARSLNYSMHLGVQNLRLRQQPTPQTVAVLLDAAQPQPLRDAWLLGLIGSLADALGAQGLQLQLCRADAQPGTSLAELTQRSQVLGLVLLGNWVQQSTLATLATLATPPLPQVAWGQPQAGRATVGFDERAVGQMATAHLLAGGAHRVLFLGDGGRPETRLRLEGYQQAHRLAGLTPDPALTQRQPQGTDAAARALHTLLAQRLAVDAVFAADDLLAISVLCALHQAGLQRPGSSRLAVVGCGDIAAAQPTWPSLSSVRLPLANAGPALLQSLYGQRAGQALTALLLAPELIVRDSSRSP